MSFRFATASTSRTALLTVRQTQANTLNLSRTMATTSQDSISNLDMDLTPAFAARHITPGIGRVSNDLVIERGKGVHVWTTDGRKWLDLTSGIGVTCLGHCHPALVKAVQQQAEQITHLQVNVAQSLPMLKLVNQLLPVMPSPELDTFFFASSGSEAVENAVKVAKHHTKRRGVVVMQGGYHGRTYAASAMTTSKTVYSAGFGTSLAGIYPAPFPYASQMNMPADTSDADLSHLALAQLQLLFKQQIPASEVACIVIEPVLGEGGYVAAPAEYLQGLRKICDEHGIVLVFDEVQCGFGRTGKMFYSEYSGVVPDMQIMAKGIAGGFPLSGIVAKHAIMKDQKPGSMGGTYSGSPIALAAASAVLETFKAERTLDNVNARSEQLFGALNELKNAQETSHLIRHVRGKGLMVGVEFQPAEEPICAATSRSGNEGPSSVAGAGQKRVKDIGSRVARKCLEKGMLILTTSVFDVIRFIPALNITEEEMAEAIKIFKESLLEVAKEG